MEEEKVSINDLYNTFLTRIGEVEQEVKEVKFDVNEIRRELNKMRSEFFVALNVMTGQILDGLKACQTGYDQCASGYGDCREAFEVCEEQMENSALAAAVADFPV